MDTAMTLGEALDTLEEEWERGNAESEYLADLGSSAFYGGAQGNGGYDAMQIAREVAEREAEASDPGGVERAAWAYKVRLAKETVAYYESIAPEPRRKPEPPRAPEPQVCGFCKGGPVHNAAAWITPGAPLYAACPRCGVTAPEPTE